MIHTKNINKTKTTETIIIIAGLVCFAYSVIIWQVRSGTGFFLIWDILGAAIIILGIMLHTGLLAQIWKKPPAMIRKTVVIITAIILLAFLAIQVIMLSGFFCTGKPDLNYVIVLGAQVRPDGPSIVLRYRLDSAYEYLRENTHTICIVSGGQGSNEPAPEATVMKEYLVNKGIDTDRIIEEDRSTSTNENIQNSMELIKDTDSDIGIITSNFHVFRGVSLAKKQGLKNACGISASSHPLYLPNNMLRETFAIIKDKLCKNI